MSFVVAVVLGLMAWFIYDLGETAARRALAPASASFFHCVAPVAEGDLTLIFITLRDSVLVGDCQYASTRRAKPGNATKEGG